MPHFNIVGLPEAAVRESRDRVRAAIQCSNFEFPNRKITANLAPADLPKDGGRFDLAIALGILAANGEVSVEALSKYECLGELALTGELREVDGVLPAALAAAKAGRALIVPEANGDEVALASDVEAYVARSLIDVVAHINGVQSLPLAIPKNSINEPIFYPDLADVRGQLQARGAMEISAAGAHRLIFMCPPGCGKT